MPAAAARAGAGAQLLHALLHPPPILKMQQPLDSLAVERVGQQHDVSLSLMSPFEGMLWTPSLEEQYSLTGLTAVSAAETAEMRNCVGVLDPHHDACMLQERHSPVRRSRLQGGAAPAVLWDSSHPGRRLAVRRLRGCHQARGSCVPGVPCLRGRSAQGGQLRPREAS